MVQFSKVYGLARSPLRTSAISASVLSICIGFGLSPAAATDGYFSNGYGIQAEGLGGASIAYPKDSIAIASNPASALFLGNRFDAGVDYFRPDRSATISGNTFTYKGNPDSFNGTYDGNSRQDFLIPSLGYVRQISRTSRLASRHTAMAA